MGLLYGTGMIYKYYYILCDYVTSFSNKHTSILCVPNISQTLATIYQLQPNEVIAVAVKKRLHDSQLVTVKICYCNDIDYIQKVLH